MMIQFALKSMEHTPGRPGQALFLPVIACVIVNFFNGKESHERFRRQATS